MLIYVILKCMFKLYSCSFKINNRLFKYALHSVLTNNENIGQLLNKSEDKFNKVDKNGSYKFSIQIMVIIIFSNLAV